MNTKRRNVLMLHWSIFSLVVIGLFWFIWYLIAGEVPEIKEIHITEEWTFALPFGISRVWWYLLVAPIWASMFVRLFTDKKENIVSALDYGFGFGLVLGLIIGLVFWLAIGMNFWLGAGEGFWLGCGLFFGFKVFGPYLGFLFALTFGIGFELSLGAGFVLVVFLLLLRAFIPTAKKIGRWLIAADKA